MLTPTLTLLRLTKPNWLVLSPPPPQPGAAATATATGASGYEIEFLIRQLDRVSEIGHLLHVGLLSVFDVSGGI